MDVSNLTVEASFLFKFNGMILKALEHTLFPFERSMIIPYSES